MSLCPWLGRYKVYNEGVKQTITILEGIKVRTNDLKKGCRVQLRNGWYATIADNLRGNIRMATVEGYYTETGSVYSHDIMRALVNGEWVDIDQTPKQKKCKKMVENIFGE